MANFDPPPGGASENPERISMKRGLKLYVVGMTTHANSCGAATTWVVWAHTRHVTCLVS